MSKLIKFFLITAGLLFVIILISCGGVAKSPGLYISENTNSDNNYQQTVVIDQTHGGIFLDYAYSIIATSDGGYILAGYTLSFGSGDSDMWLVKTNTTGQVEWNQTFGGIGEDAANSVITTPDEGYVLVGRTESYGAGNEDIWLIKITPQGDTTKATSFPVLEVTILFITIIGVNRYYKRKFN